MQANKGPDTIRADVKVMHNADVDARLENSTGQVGTQLFLTPSVGRVDCTLDVGQATALGEETMSSTSISTTSVGTETAVAPAPGALQAVHCLSDNRLQTPLVAGYLE